MGAAAVLLAHCTYLGEIGAYSRNRSRVILSTRFSARHTSMSVASATEQSNSNGCRSWCGFWDWDWNRFWDWCRYWGCRSCSTRTCCRTSPCYAPVFRTSPCFRTSPSSRTRPCFRISNSNLFPGANRRSPQEKPSLIHPARPRRGPLEVALRNCGAPRAQLQFTECRFEKRISR